LIYLFNINDRKKSHINEMEWHRDQIMK
jgi:hypothetical protein